MNRFLKQRIPGILLSLALCFSVQSVSARPTNAPLENWLKQLNRPFIIGLAGDSGSGKSTLARGLQATFGADRVKIICVDDYHCLDRQGRKAAGVTALNTKATDLERLARDLATLKQGKSIQKPIYDHSNGTLAVPEPFSPSPIIIVEGLHPFATAALRKQVDFSIYYDPSRQVKTNWKIKRDVAERGHSIEAVMASIQERIPDYKTFVRSQRKYADMVVKFNSSTMKQGDLAVQVIQRNLRPVKKLIPYHASGQSYRVSGFRVGNKAHVVLDGNVPETALTKLTSFVQRATGMKSNIERRSITLDNARTIASSRILMEIARKARENRPHKVTNFQQQRRAFR